MVNQIYDFVDDVASLFGRENTEGKKYRAMRDHLRNQLNDLKSEKNRNRDDLAKSTKMLIQLERQLDKDTNNKQVEAEVEAQRRRVADLENSRIQLRQQIRSTSRLEDRLNRAWWSPFTNLDDWMARYMPEFASRYGSGRTMFAEDNTTKYQNQAVPHHYDTDQSSLQARSPISNPAVAMQWQSAAAVAATSIASALVSAMTFNFVRDLMASHCAAQARSQGVMPRRSLGQGPPIYHGPSINHGPPINQPPTFNPSPSFNETQSPNQAQSFNQAPPFNVPQDFSQAPHYYPARGPAPYYNQEYSSSPVLY